MSVVLLLVISGCATTTPQKDTTCQLQNTGEKYLAAGDTAGSLKYLTEAERKSPDDPVIQYDLALAYEKRGLEETALNHLKNALKDRPAYPEALNAIGALYAGRGQFQPAQEAFQKALDDPFYKTPQLAAYNLGSLYEKRGDAEKALTEYQQAVKFDPNYGAAWFRIGQIFEQMHRDDDARHTYGKAIATSPDLAEANLRYGILSYQAGDMEAAFNSLSRVGKLAPDTSMADDARRYLEKLNNSARMAATHSSASSYTSPGEIEVIPNEDIRSHTQLINDDSAKSQPSQLPGQIPGETQAPATTNIQDSAGEAAPATGGNLSGFATYIL